VSLASVKLTRIDVTNIRNLASVSIELSGSINVLFGANGQGKTSLLEAVYLVATSRSFRTHRYRELVRYGTTGGSVRAWISDGLGVREQVVGLTPTHRQVLVDGTKPESLAKFAVRTPVVVFHPGEIELTMGSAAGRRTLMDRVALYFDVSSHAEHQAYDHAMKARQKLLAGAVSSIGAEGARGLEVYEQLMARHGAALSRCRSRAVDELSRAALEAFGQVAPGSLRLSMRYLPGGSDSEAEVVKQLFERRVQDGRRQTVGFGPHRDDLLLELNGHSVRTGASQGQHRLLTLSLKIGEMVCVGKASGVQPLLLLDDVSSELDADRTDAFLGLLGHREDQVLLTTTRPEMLRVFEKTMGKAKVFSVDSGCLAEVSA